MSVTRVWLCNCGNRAENREPRMEQVMAAGCALTGKKTGTKGYSRAGGLRRLVAI